ncbi:hypothetical protein [Amycolatopsis eburnea]|uniref:Uncharacterized protein n=1 Tax=Amycolatopsis eburnea TaxID=2267691 RepID=A0A427TC85_9PSEU|nr:hypothetical protein [Amycolatopsis eburnea]RSD20066.1 hypothetical protein EIY87_17780 [Amycolatopsis eburnea]
MRRPALRLPTTNHRPTRHRRLPTVQQPPRILRSRPTLPRRPPGLPTLRRSPTLLMRLSTQRWLTLLGWLAVVWWLPALLVWLPAERWLTLLGWLAVVWWLPALLVWLPAERWLTLLGWLTTVRCLDARLEWLPAVWWLRLLTTVRGRATRLEWLPVVWWLPAELVRLPERWLALPVRLPTVWWLATLPKRLRSMRRPPARLPTGVRPRPAARSLPTVGNRAARLRSTSPLPTWQPRRRPRQRRLPALHHPARIRHPRLLATARRHRPLTAGRHARRWGRRREPTRRLWRPTALDRRRSGIGRERLALAARETRCPDVVQRTSAALAAEVRGRRHAVAALGFRCCPM